MKPKWQPIVFPRECALYGEPLFQPLVLPNLAILVAGGPSALFLFRLFEIPTLEWTIEAQDRISGFAAHGSDLYVQDGPVLSRWNLKNGALASAINVVAPTQRWSGGAPVDWKALHKLTDALRGKQAALGEARRRMQFAALLEDAEAELAIWQRTPDRLAPVIPRLERMIADLRSTVGEGGAAGARQAWNKAMADASSIVISPPVVREHQIFGKAAGMVFLVARDGTLHALDDTLDHKGSKRFVRGAQPALALAEYATDADSDEFACRLYYVAEDGSVQAVDAGALPLAPLASWPARGAADLNAPLRPRTSIDKLVWGSGAQGPGIYALTVDNPALPSRVSLPAGDWRWLELRPESSLLLASTANEARLLSYALGARTVDRWGKRDNVPPSYSTFLPQSTAPEPRGRPMLVLEIDREAGEGDLAFRVLIANTVDATDPACAAWYPPPPARIMNGTLESWGTDGFAPRQVLTQPSVSRQDAYVVASDHSRAGKITSMLAPSPVKPWQKPEVPGRTGLFSYAIGNSVTRDEADRAWQALEDLRRLSGVIRLRIVHIERVQEVGSKWSREVVYPASGPVVVKFGDGSSLPVRANDGWVLLPPTKAGQKASVDGYSSCTLEPNGNNQIERRSDRWE